MQSINLRCASTLSDNRAPIRNLNPKYSKVFKSIQMYSNVFKCIQKYSKVFKSIQKYSRWLSNNLFPSKLWRATLECCHCSTKNIAGVQNIPIKQCGGNSIFAATLTCSFAEISSKTPSYFARWLTLSNTQCVSKFSINSHVFVVQLYQQLKKEK